VAIDRQLEFSLVERVVAKKKAAKKTAKTAKRTAKRSAAKQAAPAEVVPKVVVFFELSGVAGVRFLGEYTDIERARLAARSLVLSPDVGQAWVMQDLEIIRKQTG
jgi:hypothetical protein